MEAPLSPDRPWPGLAAYEESSRAYFQGRDVEVAELLQRVRRAPLTVLYGRSGLGKSSLLKAGLFPRLRELQLLPVYLRLDFSAQAAQDPVEQIVRRLQEEIAAAGLECPPRDPGESLWRWLHRKDFELWSKDNRPWTPVLVFDQFEELFSRSGGDPQRIGAVFEVLADLAENRLEREVADSRRGRESLDLITQRYKMLLSFREDFLPDVRGWQDKVPSLLRNDLRLLAMSRAQAVAAVQRAGAAVLAPGAAEQLVDFVGAMGSTNASQAPIEPALLSLCGDQLVRRLAAGGRIDAALIAQAGQDILEGFYRDALADLPDGVHRFIEDHLLQGDRTRGSYARDEALAQGFITPAQLALLTDERRLLRIDQEGGVARIELIHDRLVDVVRAARTRRAALRHAEDEREAERRASEQRARELAEAHAARLAQESRRLRWALAGVLVLLTAAFVQTWRARSARDEARDARDDAQAALQRVEQEKAVATAARNAALESHRLAEERLAQTLELLRAQYGWAGGSGGGKARPDADRVQQAVRADQAIRQVRGAQAEPPAPPPPQQQTPGMPARSAVRIEVFSKDLDADKVDQALRELGYPVTRPRAVVKATPTNALWFGSAVPMEDVQVVALALMRAGITLRAIRPFAETSVARRDEPLIQIGADTGVLERPPWTVEQLLTARTFAR